MCVNLTKIDMSLMKNYFNIFLLASLIFCEVCDAREHTLPEYYIYSSQELSKTGQEWLDFCQTQKERLSSHPEKFVKFTKYSEYVAGNSDSNKLASIEIGGGGISLPITSNMSLSERVLDSDDGYFKLALTADDGEYIRVTRSKIMEMPIGPRDKESDIKLFKEVFSDSALTETSIILGAYSITPLDIKCIASNENMDKRALFLLGAKDGRLNVIKLEHVDGFVLVGELFEPNTFAIDLSFESNGSVYRVIYFTESNTERKDYIQRLVSRVNYVPDVKSNQISLDAEFQSVREQVEKIINKAKN